MNNPREEKTVKQFAVLFSIFFLLIFFGLFFARKINLVTADLGRHIKNGELILAGEAGDVFRKNHYSYTHSDFPFVNHHWATGVIFYLTWKVVGFGGLHCLYIFFGMVIFLIFFLLMRPWKTGYRLAFIISILLIPMIAQRKEIRPEIFSYFFAGVFYYVLLRFRREKSKIVYLLPVLMVLWVNFHVGFFLGILMIGIFLFETVVVDWLKRNFEMTKKLTAALFLTFISTFLNPAGFFGAIYPANIFRNFGYDLAENKSVFFLEKYGMSNPNFFLLKMILVFVWISFVWVIVKRWEKGKWRESIGRIPLADLGLMLMFSTMALAALRNMVFFGLFSLSILGRNLAIVLSGKKKMDMAFAVCLVMGMVFWVAIIYQGNLFRNSSGWGLGMSDGAFETVKFVEEKNVKGPVFNNYDIGGYLIFHFFPKEKVFVDNRPEAYPASFFKEMYIPMQEDQEKFSQIDERYNFNSVIFYRHDITPWGQKFLVDMIENENWAPVFVDDFNIIFVKKNEENKALIEESKLPKEMFNVRKK